MLPIIMYVSISIVLLSTLFLEEWLMENAWVVLGLCYLILPPMVVYQDEYFLSRPIFMSTLTGLSWSLGSILIGYHVIRKKNN